MVYYYAYNADVIEASRKFFKILRRVLVIKKIDIRLLSVAEKVLELQKSSYQVEADIIDFYDIPPLKDDIVKLMKCNEEFWAYFVNKKIVGIISFKTSKSVLDIHRLAVHPDFLRREIASDLLDFIENMESINNVVVCTAKNNKPAINIYLKKGYKPVEDIVVEKELSLTKYVKKLDK
jgi:ribosomal protein S18 acetylase RimI-like enzyme